MDTNCKNAFCDNNFVFFDVEVKDPKNNLDATFTKVKIKDFGEGFIYFTSETQGTHFYFSPTLYYHISKNR